MIGQPRLVDAIRRAADQDEPAVAIAAIGMPALVDLQIDARMAQRRAAGDIGGAVARDTAVGNADGFWRRDHGDANSKRARP